MLNALSSMGGQITKVNQSEFPLTSQIMFNGANSLTSNKPLVIGTGPFTVEFFFRSNQPNNGTKYCLFSIGSSSQHNTPNGWFSLFVNFDFSPGYLSFVYSVNGATGNFPILDPDFSGNTTWQHFAYTRDVSGHIRGFRNGNMIYNRGETIVDFSGNGLSIGRYNHQNPGEYAYCPNGTELRGLRISNICRYTNNFTPSNNRPSKARANDLLLCNFQPEAYFLETSGTANVGNLTNNGSVTWVEDT